MASIFDKTVNAFLTALSVLSSRAALTPVYSCRRAGKVGMVRTSASSFSVSSAWRRTS
ncbi:hypothetical protein KCP69_14010 [Salmonella enterica subsp. enterica]|nr:hypothetical protein KCP69_14010 [Salmonella enterica subsp. enterica]